MFSLKSKITVKLLGYFFLNPSKQHYINELAGILEIDPGNLYRKLKELENEGIFESEERGNQKYYFLNHSYPLLKEAKKSFEMKYGLSGVLKKELIKLKGLKKVYIFGSYAKNSLQQESDIDLLLIGSHSSLEAKRIIVPLQKIIGREINIVDIEEKEFEKKKKSNDPFIKNIFGNKIIELI
ncbi:MAG: nucleotidyltransferase domain-containing protein [Patescibacteria group bacterium]